MNPSITTQLPRLLLGLLCLAPLAPAVAQTAKPKEMTPPKPPVPAAPARLGFQTFNVAYSDNFVFFTKGCKAEPAAEGAEKVLFNMCKWNPHLAEAFQTVTNDLPVPMFNVISRADQSDFKKWYFPVLEKAGASSEMMLQVKTMWDMVTGTQVNLDGETASTHKCFNFGSFLNMESSKAKNEPLAPFRIHNVASTVQSIYLRPIMGSADNAPDMCFWVTAGFVYFVEIRMTGMTETRILDFETLPDPKEKGGVKPEAYADGKKWPENVRKLARAKNTAMSVGQIARVMKATLTPDQLAFCFALQDYLHSTPEVSKKYYDYIHELRAKPALPTAAGLATALGHADVAALDKAFWEYLKSPAFKN